jgi:ABC-2 type transport system permease protein
MRWLVVKDLQILRRSPFLIALLILYPLVLGGLVGAAVSREPGKPKVAFANLVDPSDNSFSVGGEKLDASRYASELFKSIDPVPVDSREEAVAKVQSGEVLGALIVPREVTQRLQATVNLSGGEPPTLEVIYNGEDPIKRARVEAAIESRLAEANQALSERLTTVAAEYIGIVVSGGAFNLFGRKFDVLGLQRAETILKATIASLPADAPERTALEQVAQFAGLAADNLDISEPVLASVGSPVQVKQTVLNGSDTPLDAFAVSASVAFTLMLVTLLLAAGLLALEREQHTFGRLARGLVSLRTLIAGKVVLAGACATVVGLLMLALVGAFFELDLERAPYWLPALALASLAFAAMGVAIGALSREVQSASLLAFGLSLPVAFLGLVPDGSVSTALYEVISAISAAFPFKPALNAIDAAVNSGELDAGPLAHLAGLTLAFGVLARLALRRFA